MENAIVERALENLEAETGLRGEWHQVNKDYDGELTIAIKNDRIKFHVEVKKDLRFYQLDKVLDVAKHHKPFMVIADRMLNNVKERLKEEQIAYLDGSGSAYIDEGKILIIVNAKKNRTDEFRPATNRAFTRTGLRAVFHLLNNPEAINKTYRQLAEEMNIALGNIKYIMDGLREGGFILQLNKNNVKLQKRGLLLERWITGYRETLKPAIFKGAFRFLDNNMYDRWDQINAQQLEILWGGEPAAELITNYLKARQLTIYTSETKSRLITGLRLMPQPEGDIMIYEKFWKQDQEEHENVTPLLLVYADLLITEDPRCIETAKMIFDKYLKDELETD